MHNSRCSACRHPQRELIDAALLSGRSLREIARQHGLSKDAVHRHEDHIDAEKRAETRTAATLDIQDVAGRIRAIADDARATRITLQGQGQYRAALRASEVELRTLGELSSRLGIDDLAVLDQFENAQVLFQAVGHLFAYRPDIAPEVVARLREHRKNDMADAIEAFAAKFQKPKTTEEIPS